LAENERDFIDLRNKYKFPRKSKEIQLCGWKLFLGVAS
jgi:hypothetical protein